MVKSEPKKKPQSGGFFQKFFRKPEKSQKEQRLTVQRSIPYLEMGRDGICRVEEHLYSKTVRFYDINYQLAQNEDKNTIFESWCDFLNYFDASIRFQLSFINHKSDMSEYNKVIQIEPQHDQFDDVRIKPMWKPFGCCKRWMQSNGRPLQRSRRFFPGMWDGAAFRRRSMKAMRSGRKSMPNYSPCSRQMSIRKPAPVP